MKRTTVLFLVIITLFIFSACIHNNGSTADSTDNAENSTDLKTETVLSIIKDGKSDYVIICNFSDKQSKQLADDISQIIYIKYGILLNTKSQSGTYENEIIVGDTNREETRVAKSRIEQDSDFIICAVGSKLVLYATDDDMGDKMLLLFRDKIIESDVVTNEFTFSEDKNYVGSLNGYLISGNEVNIVSKGKSDYVIVYDQNDATSMSAAIYLKSFIIEKINVSIPIKESSTENKHEIIVGNVKRTAVNVIKSKMEKSDDFAVCVYNDDIVITATDREMLVLGILKFVNDYVSVVENDSVIMKESDNHIYSRFGRNYQFEQKEYCERFQAIFNTYSSYHEDKLYNTSWLTQLDKNDQALIVKLVERMKNSAAFYVGSSSVLYDGFIVKLDTYDYSKTAIDINGYLYITSQFSEKYFGKSLDTDENGYVNLSRYCNNTSDYSLYYNKDTGLAILTPKAVYSFADANYSDGNYTNLQYRTRMIEFFNSSKIPEPSNNTEQSRVVIEYVEYPRYVLDFKTNKYVTTYSPGITVVNENGKNVYYVVYELCTVMNYEELDVITIVKKSVDGGLTWSEAIVEVPDLRWSSVFENKGAIYLMGSDLYTNEAIIIKITGQNQYEKAVITNGIGGTAPGVVLIAKGRIYKAYHTNTLSAEVNSNLMDSKSWTVSNNTTKMANGGEGSILLGKDGQIYQVMHGSNPNEAYVLKLSDDGKTYTNSRASGNLIEFPTCISKSSVIYDENSGKYLSMSTVCTLNNSRQRNVMALVASDNLYDWEIVDYILVEREMINPEYSSTMHAFQYVDFRIDGEDIVFVVRETSGYTNTYHDGNYTTFYRINDYINLINK